MIQRVVIACAMVACVESPVTSNEQALDGAPADTTHTYSVGYCESETGCDKDNSGHCTASLIAPNLVITARHCVDHSMQLDPVFCNGKFLNMLRVPDMKITTHPDPHGASAAPQWYGVKKVITPSAPELCANDIALLILTTNIPATEATPAALDIKRAITPDKVAIVGRGALDVKLDEPHPGVYIPQIIDDGNFMRRIAENIPVLCQPDSMCAIQDFSDPSGMFTAHANHLVIGPSAFPGDSGSGIVAQATLNNATPVILAVTSLGGWASATEPNSTFGVHVEKHAELIKTAAQEAATAGGYPLPDWVGGTLPDGSGSGSGSDTGSGSGSDTGGNTPDSGGCATSRPSLLASLAILALALLRGPSRRRAGSSARGSAPRSSRR